MNQKPAPEAILEFVACHCRKSLCQSNMCNCYAIDLSCTDNCNCANCENNSADETETISDTSDVLSDDRSSSSHDNIYSESDDD